MKHCQKKREGGKINGKILSDKNGNPKRTKGKCKSVKAIGWYIEEYGLAQISMNITNITDTSLHKAFEECRKSANRRGLRVTGSELVGLVPKKVMIEAGKYFLGLQNRSTGVSEKELIHIAIKSLGLDEAEKKERLEAMDAATEYAIEVPLQVMEVSLSAFVMLKAMAKDGNPNSVSDAGVGALACRAAVRGAYLNVKINCADYKNEKFVTKSLAKAEKMLIKAEKEEIAILKIVDKVIG